MKNIWTCFVALVATAFLFLSKSPQNSLYTTTPSIDHQAAAFEQLSCMTPLELDQNWQLESFFGCIYVINLPDARERLKRVSQQLHDVGVEHFEILAGIDGRKEVDETLWKKMRRKWPQPTIVTPEQQQKYDRKLQGETGCYLSHLRLIETVREKYNKALSALTQAQQLEDSQKIEAALREVRKYSSVLIIEDDNGFGVVGLDRQSVTKKSVGTLFRKAMLELPADWDMLYFMSLPDMSSEVATTHLSRIKSAVVLNAFAVNHRMYDRLYEQIKKINDPLQECVSPVDVEYAHLHANARCFGIIPSIAYQNDGLSSITSVQANYLRQLQSYREDQAEEFLNSYSKLLLHPFSTSAENDARFQFQEENCTLGTLESHFRKLQENNAAGLQLERRKIAARLKEFVERKIVEGKRHSFDATLVPHPTFKLNASLVTMGDAQYLLYATPGTSDEAGALYDTALAKECSLFVSLHQPGSAHGKLAITTPNGWVIHETSRKILYSSSETNLIERYLEASSSQGEKRSLTHLSFEGWKQDTRLPDRAPFHTLLNRIEELHAKSSPLVIESKWGVGRSGVLALLHYLREEIATQRAHGTPLDEISINMAKAVFDFRKQRNGFVEHDPLLQEAYAVLIEYYKSLAESYTTT